MDKFIIKELKMMHECQPMTAHMVSAKDPYAYTSQEVTHTYEVTLVAVNPDLESARKLNNIKQAGRTVELNDSEYMNYIEPFKNEFIEFMMEKYPEKIIAGTEAWEKLIIGRR